MVTRRSFISIIGGGVVLAAAGGVSWALTREPRRARAPWATAGREETDPRRYALSYAVLAPNPHNRQPWLADLSVDGELTLYCDLDRRLPETDPFDRQITIGLGCFIELLAIAAAERGWALDTQIFPDGEPQPRLDGRPVARFRFIEDGAVERDPLFAQIPQRRSNKDPYDPSRAVADETLVDIAKVARSSGTAFTADPSRVGQLRGLAWAAMDLEMRTPAKARESIDLIRIGKAEIEASPDGIDLSGPFFEALDTLGMLSREEMADPTSNTFAQQMDAMKAPFDTAMAFIWLSTPENTRAAQIAAGRDWVRLNLAATKLGVSMHPFSQALQEFPEMRPHREAMNRALGIGSGQTLQMFGRLGYGPTPDPSPRWPFESRIRAA